MQDKIIEIKNATFYYDTDDGERAERPAVENVSLDIYEGEFVAVLGHNGCGKSTLAKLCNAIYEPTEGSVTVKGISSVGEENGDKIRRIVGMVFQNPDNQIVATIVEDDVAFGPENLGVEPAEIRKRVDNALKAVGMYEMREREPHKLSGGQKQRVAIAGVIAMQTDCIIFDEPTAMLDPIGRREVMDAIRLLNKEMGITIVLITHFMDEAVKADRVLVMDNGHIIEQGTPKQVFSQIDMLKSRKLDAPQSTQLCHDLGIGEGVIDTEDCVERVCALLGGAS